MGKKNQSARSANPIKSFCYFWLIPKVESPLLLNPNLLVARSANLESRPIRGAKNRIQTSSSASADFLPESEKRGSPPKSEKRQLLARRGSGAGGAALLRKKTNQNISADSAPFDKSQNPQNSAYEALQLFYKICEIPHPSSHTKDLQKFLIDFLKQCDCKVESDSAGNIHALKGAPKLIFQAHYDMVLVGQKVAPFVENGFLKSRDSSLGADNGIAVALLLDFAKKCKDFEILLTNDEEIGMLGAKNLKLQTHSKTMINLDSECLNEICVGCAGGFDADISLADFSKNLGAECLQSAEIYELSAQHFKGGHSGIDIDKNIKNAIVELLWTLQSLRQKCEFRILEISGGENRNSIPINAKAIIATKNSPSLAEGARGWVNTPQLTLKKLKSYAPNPTQNPLNSAVIPHLLRLHNGIYEKNGESITSSLNFSLISNESLKIMVRANSAEFLERHEMRLKALFGDSVKISGFYNAWEESSESPILRALQGLYDKHQIAHKVVQIHAGLECGILKEKCALHEVISIGPTIFYPHSKNEALDLDSFRKIYDILCDLMEL